MNKFSQIIITGLFFYACSVYGDIERLSVSSSAQQANDLSRYPSISADGRFVAFKSSASNLVENDTNGSDDMFVHDRETGVTERVSVSSTGAQSVSEGFSISRRPVINADGRYVSFGSYATNLVENDGISNDVFIRDRELALTEIVNISTGGLRANRGTTEIANPISADGRFVVFTSIANNLVGWTNGESHVFIRDRELGRTNFVSVSSSGVQGDAGSSFPSISADGRFIAFASEANNLVDGDTNGQGFGDRDIFVHARETGITERINLTTGGGQVNGQSNRPSISADGRYVAYYSNADNLVANKTNGIFDVYVRDRVTGNTEILSVSSAGVLGNGLSVDPSISADGRFIAFASQANNLVDGDTNGPGFSGRDIFVHDRISGITERVSVTKAGVQANNNSFDPVISADGRYIAFTSNATNLVDGDTNARSDVFMTPNPLIKTNNLSVTIEKLINNEARETQDTAAQLAAGTQYRQSYKVINNSPNRIYQVKVFEDGNLVCNLYTLNPGESKQRCVTFQTVLEGDQNTQVKLAARVSGTGEELERYTNAYYTGLTNVTGKLRVTHLINNIDSDTVDQAPTLDSSQATVLFKIENIGKLELYQVRAYHDPVSPVNSGWELQCVIGPMKPGRTRYCKKDISFNEPGLNQAMGRVQAKNAIRSASDVVNASNPTYFIVP